jgi:hypothetical protein
MATTVCKKYVTQAANELGRKVEQHVDHFVGFNHGLLTTELQDTIEEVKKLLAF